MRTRAWLPLPCLLLAVAALPAATALGQADAFYETATVRERPLETATAAVTVLDREAIVASGARTVAELLRLVPGLSLASHGTRGGSTTAQIRGGDPNFTLVLLDGVALNDGTYPVGEVFNVEAMPADALERVEVVRGALSAFYGSTGLAGVIHLVSRTGPDAGLEAEAELAAGNAGLGRQRAALRGGSQRDGAQGRRFNLELGHEREAGRVADERFELLHLLGRFDTGLGRESRLELATRVAAWDADDYPEASGGPVLGSGELRTSEHRELSLGATLRGPKQTASFAAYRHELEAGSPAVGFAVPASVADSRFTRLRLGWAASTRPRPKVSLAFGADVEHEQGNNTSTLLLPPFPGGEVAGDYSLDRTATGAFAELLASRGDLVFELSARVDLPRGGGAEISPRLGLSWRPGQGAVRWRASFGQAFKQPSFFALASPPALGGNPELEPERMVGGDLGVEAKLAPGLDVGLAVFAHTYRELVDFDFDRFLHVNRSRVEARGVEWSLAWRPRAGWGASAQLTWQEVEDAATGLTLRHRPAWTGGLELWGRPSPTTRLALGGSWVSRQRDEQIPVPEREWVAGVLLWDLTGGWDFAGPWGLVARLRNLADEDYETRVGFPGPGRSFEAALSWRSSRKDGAR